MEDLKKYENDIYFFYINIGSFVNSLKELGIENLTTNELKETAEKLNLTFLDTIKMPVKSKIFFDNIKKMIDMTEFAHRLLMETEVTDRLMINEKSDLLIESSAFLNTFKKIYEENS